MREQFGKSTRDFEVLKRLLKQRLLMTWISPTSLTLLMKKRITTKVSQIQYERLLR